MDGAASLGGCFGPSIDGRCDSCVSQRVTADLHGSRALAYAGARDREQLRCQARAGAPRRLPGAHRVSGVRRRRSRPRRRQHPGPAPGAGAGLPVDRRAAGTLGPPRRAQPLRLCRHAGGLLSGDPSAGRRCRPAQDPGDGGERRVTEVELARPPKGRAVLTLGVALVEGDQGEGRREHVDVRARGGAADVELMREGPSVIVAGYATTGLPGSTVIRMRVLQVLRQDTDVRPARYVAPSEPMLGRRATPVRQGDRLSERSGQDPDPSARP